MIKVDNIIDSLTDTLESMIEDGTRDMKSLDIKLQQYHNNEMNSDEIIEYLLNFIKRKTYRLINQGR